MKVRSGDVIAGACGALLLLSLWFDWYAVDFGPSVGLLENQLDQGLSAWQSYDILDLLIAVAALGGIATLVAQGTQRQPAVPVAVTVIATALAILSMLGILYRLVNQPGPNDVIGVEPGLYFGLLLNGGLIYGLGRAMRDESPRAAERPVPVEEMPSPPARAATPAPPPAPQETEPAEGQGTDPREPT